VSRSKHTDPRSIRAARRIQAPFEPRSAGDLGLRRKAWPDARGTRQLLVIPDENAVDHSAETWSHLGKEVEFGCLQIPVREFKYHYRLIASMALAEVSRQVGVACS